MKTNQIILLMAIVVILGWLTFKPKKVEYLNEESDLVLYIERRETPNPFIVADMAKQITSDERKIEILINLAAAKKKDELLKYAKTL
jgi:hypothetical protein